MHVDVAADAAHAADLAASSIAVHLEDALSARSHATLALSGGDTPALMFSRLASYGLPWHRVHVFQVDERAVPAGDAASNWPTLAPVARRVPRDHRHPMLGPDTDTDDESALLEAANRYGSELSRLCGAVPALDVVHLGLGADGHTASLPPGDPVVDVHDRSVALTQPFRGPRRLTLTRPVLDAAHCVVWLVTGTAKANVVAGLVQRDPQLVASRVARARATLVVDAAAAAILHGDSERQSPGGVTGWPPKD
ncbi:MAG: 6-phosphogluconolactonase [Actinomycetes bacterium]